jgi:hypothetical protein
MPDSGALPVQGAVTPGNALHLSKADGTNSSRALTQTLWINHSIISPIARTDGGGIWPDQFSEAAQKPTRKPLTTTGVFR